MHWPPDKVRCSKTTWYELWEELQESASYSRPVSPVCYMTYLLKLCDHFLVHDLYLYDIMVSSYFLQLFPADKNITSHGQTLHERTTLAILIKVDVQYRSYYIHKPTS